MAKKPHVSVNTAVRSAVMPARLLFWKLGISLLAMTALVIVILSKNNSAVTQSLRVAVMDVASPAVQFVSHPIDTIASAVELAGNVVDVYAENQRLMAENVRLRKWQHAAMAMQQENDSMRSLLGFVPDDTSYFISSRIIGDSSGLYQQSAIINAGDTDGVNKGNAVIAVEGFVGRVVDVAHDSSRVLLLNDINARIPVLIEGAKEHSILAGDNTAMPELRYLPVDSVIEPGMRVVTSGEGGAFPPNIPVGTVVLGQRGELRVQPFVNRSRLQYVSVVDYQAKQP